MGIIAHALGRRGRRGSGSPLVHSVVHSLHGNMFGDLVAAEERKLGALQLKYTTCQAPAAEAEAADPKGKAPPKKRGRPKGSKTKTTRSKK